MESINILRLKTGEDIICYMEHYGHDEIVVRDAMMVFMKMDYKVGKQLVQLEHWLPVQIIKENETIIKSSDVMAIINPSNEFVDYYTNAVSVIKQVKMELDTDTTQSSDDDKLSTEDMNLILDMVGPSNQMH